MPPTGAPLVSAPEPPLAAPLVDTAPPLALIPPTVEVCPAPPAFCGVEEPQARTNRAPKEAASLIRIRSIMFFR